MEGSRVPLNILEMDYDDLNSQFFSYVWNGVATHFHVNRIIKRAKNKPVHTVPIDRGFAKWALRNNGIEQHRLDRLLQVPKDKPFDPVHYIVWSNGKHVLVDGSHRYVASYLQKRETIEIRVLPFLEWQDCTIKLPTLEDPLAWTRGHSHLP